MNAILGTFASRTPRYMQITSGDVLGHLTVIEANIKRGQTRECLCKCDCGNELTVNTYALLNGQKSCSCRQMTAAVASITKTGSRSRTADSEVRKFYSAWCGMKARCSDPKHKDYKYYGALGVSVCDWWQTFENFQKDMWPRPDGMTLDRKNPFLEYSKDNCKWATATEQANNKRKNWSGQK